MGRARSFFFENKNTTQYVGGPLKKKKKKRLFTGHWKKEGATWREPKLLIRSRFPNFLR